MSAPRNNWILSLSFAQGMAIARQEFVQFVGDEERSRMLALTASALLGAIGAELASRVEGFDVKLLPYTNDTPEQAERKIAAVLSMLDALLNGERVVVQR